MPDSHQLLIDQAIERSRQLAMALAPQVCCITFDELWDRILAVQLSKL